MIKFKLLVACLIYASSLSLVGQNETTQMVLNNFKIELDGSKIELDTTIKVVLTQDIMKDIILLEKDSMKYGAEFTYKHKGRRAKLTRRTYVELPDGKQVFSKRKKDMQELKVSVPGSIKGKSAESILYSKHTMGYIFVSFNYEYHYK